LALAEEPNHPLAHALMAMCLSEREQFDLAAHHARQAIVAAPDTAFPHYSLAVVYVRRNQLKEAVEAIRAAIDLEPQDPDYHELLGRIHVSRHQWQEALQCAKEALACDPGHINARNLKTLALRHLGQGDAATVEMLETLAEDPDNAWTHANLAWQYLEKKDTRQAMHHFREALRIEPELEWARIGVLETLKSRNPLYRVFLRYFLWMGRLTQSGQWKVILGLWLLYVVLNQVARSVPAVAPWITPLLIVYVLFALGTWLAAPLADLALRLHRFGRLALSRRERRASNWIGGSLLAAMVSVGGGVATGHIGFAYLAGFFLLMLLPLSATLKAAWPQPQKAMLIYTGLVTLLGVGFVVGGFLAGRSVPAVFANPLNLCLEYFPLAAILSLIAGNVLSSIGWVR
ncbi:MAG: tetratricopeptide repeat protein, partial [Thermoguttaceae bacterium]